MTLKVQDPPPRHTHQIVLPPFPTQPLINPLLSPTQTRPFTFIHRLAGSVVVATWNPAYRKLTTSDQNGLIIVWMMHKGAWFEEMINNRHKSVVRDMRWRGNGQEICIAYEDGVVIVGGVDGNRIWSKDLSATLTLVEWSPDGKALLFATADGQILVHNHQGVRLGVLPMPAIRDTPAGARVAAIEWYDGAEGHSVADAPTLAVAFDNGRVQIMRNVEDELPVLIDTGLRLSLAKWNPNGTVLAVAGMPTTAGSDGTAAEVQFYTSSGRYTTTLRVPGGAISSITWEGGGLRMAVSGEIQRPL
jgi:WD repeat-containing protein 35